MRAIFLAAAAVVCFSLLSCGPVTEASPPEESSGILKQKDMLYIGGDGYNDLVILVEDDRGCRWLVSDQAISAPACPSTE